MTSDNEKPGLKKAGPPRPTVVAGEGLTPSSIPIEYERTFSDNPVSDPDAGIDMDRMTPPAPFASVNNPVINFNEQQLKLVVEQLKQITVSTLKSSIPPAPGTPSIPVRVAKGTQHGVVLVSVGLTLMGIVVEWAARTYLNVDGPWTNFAVSLGKILQQTGN